MEARNHERFRAKSLFFLHELEAVWSRQMQIVSSFDKGHSRMKKQFMKDTRKEGERKFEGNIQCPSTKIEEKQARALMVSGSDIGCENSIVNSSKQRVLAERSRELKGVSERLQILEEESKTMKQEFVRIMRQRRDLVNEIYDIFQNVPFQIQIGNQILGIGRRKSCDRSLDLNPIENGEASISSLSQVVCKEFNPSFVTKELETTTSAPPDHHELFSEIVNR